MVSLSYQRTHAAPKIMIVTENIPITKASDAQPDGGEATRFVEALMQEAGLEYQLRFVPWHRGYLMAQQIANTMIFPVARTEQREAEFQWVGKLIPVHYYLFRLKDRSDLRLQEFSDIAHHQIGVVNYHAHHEYLLRHNMQHLQPVNNSDQNIRKLLLNRIDFFPMSDTGIFPLCTRTEIDCGLLIPEIEMPNLSSGLYIAFSNSTSPAVVNRLKAAYERMVIRGDHASIFANRRALLKKFKDTYHIDDSAH